MPTHVKLNSWEQEALTNQLIHLNKKLVMSGYKPIKSESEIVHRILEMTLGKLEINDNGTIKITEKIE